MRRDRVQLQHREGSALGRFGGWLLMAFGGVLIALAAVFASEVTVAPIFAFGGIACVVLGPILSRMEGDFELTASSLRARLTAVQGVARRDDLTLEDKADEIIRLVDTDEISSDFVERVSSSSPPTGQKGTQTGRRNGSRLDAQHRAIEFARLVQDRLQAEGLKIDEPTSPLAGYDFLAYDGQRRWFVETKARRRLSTADVQQAIAQLQWASRGQNEAGYVLAVPAGSLTGSAGEALRSLGPNYRVIEVPFPEE